MAAVSAEPKYQEGYIVAGSWGLWGRELQMSSVFIVVLSLILFFFLILTLILNMRAKNNPDH